MFPGHLAALLLRRHRPLRSVLALCSLVGLTAAAQAEGSGLTLGQTVAGVLAYTRWPTEPDPLRLCVTGTGPHAEQLLHDGLPRPDHAPLPLRRLEPGRAVASQCDVLYIGLFDAQDWRRLGPELNGRPVLTICESSDACTAIGMVRLDMDPAAANVRFAINLDAVARSTVRIHPQVLRLGRRPAVKERP